MRCMCPYPEKASVRPSGSCDEEISCLNSERPIPEDNIRYGRTCKPLLYEYASVIVDLLRVAYGADREKLPTLCGACLGQDEFSCYVEVALQICKGLACPEHTGHVEITGEAVIIAMATVLGQRMMRMKS